MIVFLFGSWGAGKSHVGAAIEQRTGLPHMEADLHFRDEMVVAIQQRRYHKLDLGGYYSRVVAEMQSYQRRSPNFMVSQGIYQEKYRQMIYDFFAPEISFVWVRTPKKKMQMDRIQARAQQGNPITPQLYAYMAKRWEAPQLPHQALQNNDTLEAQMPKILENCGLGYYWPPDDEIS